MLKDPEKILSCQLRNMNSHTKRENWSLRFVRSRGKIRVYWWHAGDGNPPIIDYNNRKWHGILVGWYPADKPFIAVCADEEV